MSTLKTTWGRYHENLLKKWSEMCKTYSIMHSLSAAYYSAWDKRLGIPVVILGAATSASIISGEDWKNVMKYVNGVSVLIVSALAGISKFLGTAEKTTKHQNASFKYTSIALHIDSLMSFPRNERSHNPQEFITDIKTKMLEIREHAPEPLNHIMNEYLKNYDKGLTNINSRINKQPVNNENKHIIGYRNPTGPIGYKYNDSFQDSPSYVNNENTKLEAIKYHMQSTTTTPPHKKESMPECKVSDFSDKTSQKVANMAPMLAYQTDGEFSESEEDKEENTKIIYLHK